MSSTTNDYSDPGPEPEWVRPVLEKFYRKFELRSGEESPLIIESSSLTTSTRSMLINATVNFIDNSFYCGIDHYLNMKSLSFELLKSNIRARLKELISEQYHGLISNEILDLVYLGVKMDPGVRIQRKNHLRCNLHFQNGLDKIIDGIMDLADRQIDSNRFIELIHSRYQFHIKENMKELIETAHEFMNPEEIHSIVYEATMNGIMNS